MKAVFVTGGKQYTATVGDVLFIEKLNIITYKPKKGSARRMGHRQPYTKVEITNIVG